MSSRPVPPNDTKPNARYSSTNFISIAISVVSEKYLASRKGKSRGVAKCIKVSDCRNFFSSSAAPSPSPGYGKIGLESSLRRRPGLYNAGWRNRFLSPQQGSNMSRVVNTGVFDPRNYKNVRKLPVKKKFRKSLKPQKIVFKTMGKTRQYK